MAATGWAAIFMSNGLSNRSKSQQSYRTDEQDNNAYERYYQPRYRKSARRLKDPYQRKHKAEDP